jgi:hypothetical protein
LRQQSQAIFRIFFLGCKPRLPISLAAASSDREALVSIPIRLFRVAMGTSYALPRGILKDLGEEPNFLGVLGVLVVRFFRLKRGRGIGGRGRPGRGPRG